MLAKKDCCTAKITNNGDGTFTATGKDGHEIGTWSQTGPIGPPGPAGATGLQGPAGADGALGPRVLPPSAPTATTWPASVRMACFLSIIRRNAPITLWFPSPPWRKILTSSNWEQ